MPTDHYAWECLVAGCGDTGDLDGDVQDVGDAYDGHYAEQHGDLDPPQPAYSFAGPAVALAGDPE